MSGILAEFVEKIISLKDPTIIEVAGQQYANPKFARIKPHVDRPSVYEVTGLDSIVQLLRKEIERVGGFAFVRVASYDQVCVSTSYRADMSRDTLYTATADVPGFRQWGRMAHCVYYERLVLMGHTPGQMPLWVRTATPPEEDEV